METLADKLKSLGVMLGAKNIPPSPAPDNYPIEMVADVNHKKTIFGNALLIEKIYPADYQHGLVSFSSEINYQLILDWAKVQSQENLNLDKFIFFDTETTGLSGGSGTFVFLVGLGYWESGLFRLVQLFLPEPVEEPALLAAFNEILDPFQIMVSFNGKTFDTPLLKARHVINGFKPDFINKQHVDLLHLSRKIWKNRLSRRALGDLEREILSFQRDDDEIPGWLVPEMYKDYLQTRDARPLKGVLNHNAIDIVSLAALFIYVSKILNDPVGMNIPGLDLISIAKFYEDLGDFEYALKLYEIGLGQEIPLEFYVKTLHKYAYILKRTGKIDLSIMYLQQAAILGDLQACEELAKHFEHSEKDLTSALYWTETGLSISQANPQFVRRKCRIMGKL